LGRRVEGSLFLLGDRPASHPNSGRHCCHRSNPLPPPVFVKHVKTNGIRARECASM
jgi:hypothetical protein